MTQPSPNLLNPDRYFDTDPAQRRVARELYEASAKLPIVSPHGHVLPEWFSDPGASFGSPTELLIIPDHYVFRMLYSQGITLDRLGVPTRDGSPTETDHRKIWQLFADHFYLFRGTPTGMWLTQELVEVFAVDEKLSSHNAQDIYTHIEARLAEAAFKPRALFDRFNIEVLCTTDPANSRLEHHQAIRDSDWGGAIRPTFRPDGVVHLLVKGWQANIIALSEASGINVTSYANFLHALMQQREHFKALGATATDHAAETAHTTILSESEAEAIFQRALRQEASEADARAFVGHMLTKSAEMSIEDGLVMQLHVGSIRNHNSLIFQRFGPDKGCDIPHRVDFTHSLRPLLERVGNHTDLTLILFTLDESAYARELAPLAGHYPILKLGPPWWFHDSLNGMARYFDQVMETTGLHNTVGFNDDTRAFPSIPARHDVWRRASANWIAGMVVRGIVDLEDAYEMNLDLAYRLAKTAYRLD
ncbi:MAG: glucuronate isomerase [Chloroflexi bacterium]|nr:glucuronate isomerase [Chloroflexota bacterium]